MEKLTFNPATGYENATSFPDPTSETQTRKMLMEMPNQIKTFINDKITTKIDNIDTTLGTKANSSDLGTQVTYEWDSATGVLNIVTK